MAELGFEQADIDVVLASAAGFAELIIGAIYDE